MSMQEVEKIHSKTKEGLFIESLREVWGWQLMMFMDGPAAGHFRPFVTPLVNNWINLIEEKKGIKEFIESLRFFMWEDQRRLFTGDPNQLPGWEWNYRFDKDCTKEIIGQIVQSFSLKL